MRRVPKVPRALTRLPHSALIARGGLPTKDTAEAEGLAHTVEALLDHVTSLQKLHNEIRGMCLDCTKRTVSRTTVESRSVAWKARLENIRKRLDSLGDSVLAKESSNPRIEYAWLVAHSCVCSLGKIVFNLELAIAHMESMMSFAELLSPTVQTSYNWECASDVALYAQTNDVTYHWQRASDQCTLHVELAGVRLEASQMVCEMMLMGTS